jgi:hypothetical protein
VWVAVTLDVPALREQAADPGHRVRRSLALTW